MFKLPLSEIIGKIRSNSGLSEAEINTKIEDKMKQLSGLISQEGAAHIIANELGIKLFEQPSGVLKIKNILAGMRNVEAVGKVMKKYEMREFQTGERSGKVASFLIGDETGIIRAVLWNDQVNNFVQFSEGAVVKISGAYVKESNMGRKELHLNDRSKLVVNPAGVEIKEVAQAEAVADAVRKMVKDLQGTDSNAELMGTIVQIFEPKFYEICPNCSKRIRPTETGISCPIHGAVEPDFGYVMNIVLDDGTGTIRVVFFREQVDSLLGKTKEQVMFYKDNPVEFEAVKHELLGQIVKISGRATRNEMFDRIEFTSRAVERNPNPDEEIKRLDEEIGKL